MPQVAAQPDDGADLGLYPHQAVGLVGCEFWPAFGQGVAQRGGTALQAVPLGSGRLHRAGLVGVAVPQFLEVVAGAGDGLFLFGAVDLLTSRCCSCSTFSWSRDSLSARPRPTLP